MGFPRFPRQLMLRYPFGLFILAWPADDVIVRPSHPRGQVSNRLFTAGQTSAMDGFLTERLKVAILLVGMATVAGCAPQGRARSASLWPFGGKTTDVVPGVPSPAERTALLRSLAEQSATAGPTEQENIASQLAAVYRQEDDPLIRAEIVRTLSGYRSEAANSLLRAALNDSNADVRVAACRVWGARKDEEAVALLSRALGSDVDVDVRLAAAEALGETGLPAAVPALGQALEDRDPAMQYRAVASLRKVTGQDLGNDVNRWRQYVKGELPTSEKPVSVVERFRRMF